MKKAISLVMMVLILVLSIVPALAGSTSTTVDLVVPIYASGLVTEATYDYSPKKSDIGIAGKDPVYTKLTLSGSKVNCITGATSSVKLYKLYVEPTQKNGSLYMGVNTTPVANEKISVTWYYKTKTMSRYQKWTEGNGFSITVPGDAEYKGAKFYAQLTHKIYVYSTSVGKLSKNGVKLKTSEQIGKIVYKNKSKTITTTSKSKVYTIPKK